MASTTKATRAAGAPLEMRCLTDIEYEAYLYCCSTAVAKKNDETGWQFQNWNVEVGVFPEGDNCLSEARGRSVESARGIRLSLKDQSPAVVERAKSICLVALEARRLDSMKMPTLSVGMGSANKYPWADSQPADTNSLRWVVVPTPSATTLRSRLCASPTIVLTMA